MDLKEYHGKVFPIEQSVQVGILFAICLKTKTPVLNKF
jgi:hypothetical protein